MCYFDTWAHFNFSITCMFWEYAAYHKTQQITNLKTAQLMGRNQGSRRYDYKVTKLLFYITNMQYLGNSKQVMNKYLLNI